MRRYEELDGLRGLAALTVFFSHANYILGFSGALFLSINYSVAHFLWDGHAAVIMFFVLSGFVLTLPFIGSYEETEFNYLFFIVKRFFRIYPAFIVSILFTLFSVKYVFNSDGLSTLSPWVNSFWHKEVSFREILRTFTLIANNYDTSKINPVIWSLKIEMQISLMFPIIILLINYINKIKYALIISMILLLGSYFLNFTLLSYFNIFLIGAFAAKFKDQLSSRFLKLNIFIKIVLVFTAILTYTFRFAIPNAVSLNLILAEGIISIAAAFFIIFTLSNQFFKKLLSSKVFNYFGKTSYSFYLFHLPILIITVSLSHPFINNVFVCIILGLLMAIIISYIVYTFIEIPFQKLGKVLAAKVKQKGVYIKTTIDSEPSNL